MFMPYYRETCFQRPEKCLYFEIIDYRYCTVTIYTGSYYTVYSTQTSRYYFQTSVTILRLPRLPVTISRLPLLFLDFLLLFLDFLDFPLLFLDFRYYSQTSQTFRYYFQTSVIIPRLPVTVPGLPVIFCSPSYHCSCSQIFCQCPSLLVTFSKLFLNCFLTFCHFSSTYPSLLLDFWTCYFL